MDTDFVDAVADSQPGALAELDRLCTILPGELAVRSSAVGEDSVGASFAGQHATVLNAIGPKAVRRAVIDVWASGRTDSAQGYRARMGTDRAIRMGVVLQRLVSSDTAGVLFTCNPVTGDVELVIEATWGLGEAVVQGLVIPDCFRLTPSGRLLERRTGYKEIRIQRRPEGGTATETVPAHLVEQACLDEMHLTLLHGLSTRCCDTFGAGPHDIEWAFEKDVLYLLQLRPVTTMQPG
ncbi:hypothetical protein ILP92_17455 [Maribius pontilimi]|uniref:Pyruvate phosphate dikinase AMP/ATP-binding domain-containing protein n=1 Tax=Palleronia pontilimi TaxID=1964209 RepID=A0A934IL25_9RHOB|nr:PEP/pyruvate-binding domain-containing protein [Palleronia pontilimi]MBJ3764525.1 hypothetical protein [Palleronia pontilimi]